MIINGTKYPDLLTAAEVAELFRVDQKTPTRWAKAGRLTAVRTPTGHIRFLANEVAELLDGMRSR